MEETGIQFPVSFSVPEQKKRALDLSRALRAEKELEDVGIASIWEVLLTARLAKFFYGEK